MLSYTPLLHVIVIAVVLENCCELVEASDAFYPRSADVVLVTDDGKECLGVTLTLPLVATGVSNDRVHVRSRDLVGWCDKKQLIDVSRAVDYFTEEIRRDNRSRWALNCRASAYLELDDAPHAIRDFESLVSLSPSASTEAARLAAIHLANEDPQSALQVLDLALKRSLDDPLIRSTRALTIARLGNLSEGIDECTAAIHRWPEDGRLFFIRGRILQERGDNRGAIIDLHRSIKRDPRNPNPYAASASASILLGEIDEAITDCDSAIKHGAQRPQFYALRAGYLHLAGRGEDAILDHNTALRLDPREKHYYVGRGFALLAIRRHELARADFSAALELDDSLAIGWYGRGRAETEMKDLSCGIEDLTRALSFVDQKARRHEDRLREMRRAAEDGSVSFFTVEHSTTLASCLRERALAYSLAGDKVAAMKDIKQALKLVHGDPRALMIEGDILHQSQFYPLAIISYSTAIDLEPRDPQLYEKRAASWFAAKEIEKGNQDIEAAKAFRK